MQSSLTMEIRCIDYFILKMIGKRNATTAAQKLYTGRNVAMLFSIFSTDPFFCITLKIRYPTKIKCRSIKRLLPITANLFGLNPNKESL